MITTETFYVENMKYAGCERSIKNVIGKIPGVHAVEVYLEQAKVCIMGIGLNRSPLREKLSSFGYPEKGKNSLLKQIKSIISCGLGRME